MSTADFYEVKADRSLGPLYLSGRLRADRTIEPFSGGYWADQGPGEPPPPSSGFRDPYQSPGKADDPLRQPLSTTAIYGSLGEPITDAMVNSTGGVVNHRNGWSRQPFDGRVAGAILSTFTNPNTGATIDLWVPGDFSPPAGSNGLTADGACWAYQPDGSSYDLYKPVMQSRGTRTSTNPGGTKGQWTSTRWVQQTATGSLVLSGVSAAGISYAAGLIRAWECDAVEAGTMDDYGHAFAASIFPRDNTIALKPAPITAADGGTADALAYDTIGGVATPVALYPANTRDTQVGGNIYNGTVPMGTTYAIPRTVVVENLSFWGQLDVWGKAAIRNLQRRGVVVTDAGGSKALYAEPAASTTAIGSWNSTTNTGTGIIEAWRLAAPHLRQVKNITPAQPAGGPAPYLAPVAAPFA